MNRLADRRFTNAIWAMDKYECFQLPRSPWSALVDIYYKRSRRFYGQIGEGFDL
jgi:hypothetical protein